MLSKVEHFNYATQRVDRRLAKTPDRPDLWTDVLKRKEKEGMTLEEMYSNSSIFMVAGTETPATWLRYL